MSEQPSSPSPSPAPGQTSAPPPPRSEFAADFFDRIRSFGAVRPDEGRWIAGVCAGLARRFGVDPLLIRGAFVALCVLGGSGVPLYGLAWLLMPHPDGRIHAQQVLRGVVTAGFVGGLLCLVSGISTGWWRWGGPGPWGGPFVGFPAPGAVVAVVAIGFVWWLIATYGTKQAPPPPTGYGPGAAAGGPGAPGMPGAPAGPATPGGTQGTGYPGTGSGYPATGSGYSGSAYSPPPGGTATFTPTGTGWSPTGTGSSGSGAGSSAAPTGYAPGPVTVRTPVRTPAPPDRHAPLHALTLTTLGLALLAGAGVLAWDAAVHRLPANAGLIAAAVALGVIAVGVVIAGILGRRSGGLAPIAVILAIVAVNGTVLNNAGILGVKQTWRPVTSAAMAGSYDRGVGSAVLDLTTPGLASSASVTNPLEPRANLGVGRLTVIVPAGMPVEVDAKVGLGNVVDRVGGTGRSGAVGTHQVINIGGTNPVMLVTANVGVGEIQVLGPGMEVQP